MYKEGVLCIVSMVRYDRHSVCYGPPDSLTKHLTRDRTLSEMIGRNALQPSIFSIRLPAAPTCG